MSACLNPACSTDQPVLSWLDPDYCSHACRDAHGPLSEREPDLTCARKACPVVPDTSVRNAMGGYCSKTCIALDTPAPVEAWAAAMGRAVGGMGISVADVEASVPLMSAALHAAEPVEPLGPVPARAETPETPREPLRAIKPPATVVRLDAQTAAEELADAEQIGAATVRPLLGDALRATGGIVSARITTMSGRWLWQPIDGPHHQGGRVRPPMVLPRLSGCHCHDTAPVAEWTCLPSRNVVLICAQHIDMWFDIADEDDVEPVARVRWLADHEPARAGDVWTKSQP